MTTRARLSDSQLLTHENEIALLNRIQNEVRALSLDLDVDTLAYVHRRLTLIIENAAKAKAIAIARMNDEKTAVAESRR